MDYELAEYLRKTYASLIKWIIDNNQQAIKVFNSLKENDFYSEIEKNIFSSMNNLYLKKIQINETTILDDLIGSQKIYNESLIEEYQKYLIESISWQTGNENSIEYFIKIIKDYSTKKRLDFACSEFISKNVSLTTSKEIFKNFHENVLEILNDQQEDKIPDLNDSINTLMDRIKGNYELLDNDKVIYSGYDDIDRLTKGFRPGQLIVVAARPGMGKTTFALNIIRNSIADLIQYNENLETDSSQKPKIILMFSLEMNTDELLRKFITMETMKNVDNFFEKRSSKNYDYNEAFRQTIEHDAILFENSLKRIKRWPLLIDDKSSQSITEIESKIYSYSKEYDIALVVVDYLQLISSGEGRKFENRALEVAKVSKAFKVLARDYKTPIIAMAQLSRRAEDRSDGNQNNKNPIANMFDSSPKLSDLKESGAIEQDSDIVAFIHYNRKENDLTSQDKNMNLRKKILDVKLIIEKNRSGETGDVKITFNKELSLFSISK